MSLRNGLKARLISAIAGVALVVGLIPLPAFAEVPDGITVTIPDEPDPADVTVTIPEDPDPADITVTAPDDDTYTVTVSVNDESMGTAAADPTSCTAGTEVTLTATPNQGYRFKAWSVISGGVAITDDKFIIGAADVAVQAVFEAIPLGSGKQDIDLAIDVQDKVYGEDVKCIVYASVDGEYVLSIEGYPPTTITVCDSLAFYNARVLPAGGYKATVSFSGNDDYNPASAEDTFTVSATGTTFEIRGVLLKRLSAGI